MAVVSLVGVMPAAHVADHLGRKWTIVPSCLGLAAALCIMAKTGTLTSCSQMDLLTALVSNIYGIQELFGRLQACSECNITHAMSKRSPYQV